MLGNQCIESCGTVSTDGQIIFTVDTFLHREEDIQQICFTDCPNDYPYYYKIDAVTSPTAIPEKHFCTAECPSALGYKNFRLNEDPNITRKTCMEKCDKDSGYKFLFGKQCYQKCPENFEYYYLPTGTVITNAEDVECFSECPPGHPYHLSVALNELGTGEDIFKCIDTCEGTSGVFLHYDTKTCVKEDSIINKFLVPKISVDIPNNMYIDNCDGVWGKYVTFKNECAKDCDDTSFPQINGATDYRYYKIDEENHKCICQNLFIVDSENNIICQNPETVKDCNQAKDKDNNFYPYLKEGTKQCLSHCPTLISTDNVCLTEMKCPEGTEIKIFKDGTTANDEQGYRRCKCKNIFYQYDNGSRDFCLANEDDCPLGYEIFDIDLKQCIGTCDSAKKFNEFCFSSTPIPDSDKTWYQKSKHEIVLLNSNKCIGEYPFLITDRKNECVKNCKNNKYYILKGNECVNNCPPSGDPYKEQTLKISGGNPVWDFADYVCQCKNLWYFKDQISGIECLTDTSIKSCQAIDGNVKYQYLIKQTNQCVEKCDVNMPYVFNYECFKNCNEAGLINKFNLIESTNKQCVCANLWKKNTTKKIKDWNIPVLELPIVQMMVKSFIN